MRFSLVPTLELSTELVEVVDSRVGKKYRREIIMLNRIISAVRRSFRPWSGITNISASPRILEAAWYLQAGKPTPPR